VPPAEWLKVPVPALVSEDLFAAVAEQLHENRRRARTGRRGARYLLQGLLACRQCGYAYYGKAISSRARKHPTRHYAYYRYIGADAYRFGGERLCHNPQVRTDRLEEAVWQEVRGLLEHPQRLLEEYTRRLNGPGRSGVQTDPAGLPKQIAQARQGIARLIDAYADGYLEKSEFEPRLTRLKERVARLEAQRQQQAEDARAETELRLIIGRLEDFGARVRAGIEQMGWLQRRELIRTLVKRVEIDQDEVNVVFWVQPTPDPSAPDLFLPDCGRRDTSDFGTLHAAYRLRSVPSLFQVFRHPDTAQPWPQSVHCFARLCEARAFERRQPAFRPEGVVHPRPLSGQSARVLRSPRGH
jgi:site-specific DNA recombinase